MPNVLKMVGRSVFAKVVAMTLLSAVFLTAFVAIEFSQLAKRTAHSGVAQFAEVSTQSVANRLGGALKFKKVEDISAALTALQDGAGDTLIRATVFTEDGTVLASVGAGSATPVSSDTIAALENSQPLETPEGLVIVHPVRFGNASTVVGGVTALWTAEPVIAGLWGEQLRTGAIAGIALIGIATLSTFFLNRILGQPLGQVNQAIRSLVQGDYDIQIEAKNPANELGQISEQINFLSDKLQAARQVKKQRESEQAAQKLVVDTLNASLGKLSTGDLNEKIVVDFNEENASLRQNFNSAVEQLRLAIEQVIQSSNSISLNAASVSQSSDELARRTEEQAATIAETAASLDQINVKAETVASSAKSADKIVSQARERVSQGERVVQEAVDAMAQIEQSSTKMSQIVSVIDDIAFQTNLLALNAGVEAARAGDAGSGFAVVASEVRALAQRSSDSAHEIKKLINQSGGQVALGVELVQKAGGSLSDIVGAVVEITSQIDEIAKSAVAQSDALAEITSSVGSLDRVTQQNAAMAEETTAATLLLKQDTVELNSAVQLFATMDNSGADGKGTDGLNDRVA